ARTIIERSSFQDTGATNVRDVLRRVPGVQVQESNGTGGSDVSLNVGVRGLTSRLSPRSTILMDGIPLAVAPYGQPQLSMAPVSWNDERSMIVRAPPCSSTFSSFGFSSQSPTTLIAPRVLSAGVASAAVCAWLWAASVSMASASVRRRGGKGIGIGSPGSGGGRASLIRASITLRIFTGSARTTTRGAHEPSRTLPDRPEI
ncbi:MAG: TonB-dependent receptor plug domain-containing protein, partial [Myxococcaceae bacterium]|nr:TonB-dependent receptor plug domain-containing protein [Myxococcaceae bacterium]